MKIKFNAQQGQASRLLLVLAVVVLVAAIITFLIIKFAEKPEQPKPPDNPVPQPVYEHTLDGIRFIFQSAVDKGDVLKASNAERPARNIKDVSAAPGGKFVRVTVAGQNKGSFDTRSGAWGIGNLVDSEGRNFIPVGGSTMNQWLPGYNLCGAVLKPEFDPSPCTKMYEVSKASTGLKVTITAGKKSFLLDLIIK